MTESSDLPGRVRAQNSVVLEMLRVAQALRRKAEELEKASDKLKADAASALADHLEELADSSGGP
jgi:hypothetical protein